MIRVDFNATCTCGLKIWLTKNLSSNKELKKRRQISETQKQ